MQILRLSRGLKLASPLLCCALWACASNPVLQTRTITVKVPVVEPVPSALTAPVPAPVMRGDTNGALAGWALDLREALETANAKLKQISEIK